MILENSNECEGSASLVDLPYVELFILFETLFNLSSLKTFGSAGFPNICKPHGLRAPSQLADDTEDAVNGRLCPVITLKSFLSSKSMVIHHPPRQCGIANISYLRAPPYCKRKDINKIFPLDAAINKVDVWKLKASTMVSDKLAGMTGDFLLQRSIYLLIKDISKGSTCVGGCLQF